MSLSIESFSECKPLLSSKRGGPRVAGPVDEFMIKWDNAFIFPFHPKGRANYGKNKSFSRDQDHISCLNSSVVRSHGYIPTISLCSNVLPKLYPAYAPTHVTWYVGCSHRQ